MALLAVPFLPSHAGVWPGVWMILPILLKILDWSRVMMDDYTRLAESWMITLDLLIILDWSRVWMIIMDLLIILDWPTVWMIILDLLILLDWQSLSVI